jgi:hypothetical protein
MLTIIVETMGYLNLDERVILGSVNARSLRHPFGRQSVADIVQKVSGVVSL